LPHRFIILARHLATPQLSWFRVNYLGQRKTGPANDTAIGIERDTSFIGNEDIPENRWG
jgi:hypothetical protein